jgi:riboflavin biosynthesis pyrimidine reductase
MRELRKRGIETVSAIGGRTAARALLRDGVVDDLYLTTSAKEGGEPNTPLLEKRIDAPAAVIKEGTGPEEGVRFVHYAFRSA